jgi:hypothetical protein
MLAEDSSFVAVRGQKRWRAPLGSMGYGFVDLPDLELHAALQRLMGPAVAKSIDEALGA